MKGDVVVRVRAVWDSAVWVDSTQLPPGFKTLVFSAAAKEGRAVTVTDTIDVIPQ